MKSLINRLPRLTQTEAGIIIVLIGFLLIALAGTTRADEDVLRVTTSDDSFFIVPDQSDCYESVNFLKADVIYPEELQVRVEKLEEGNRAFIAYIEYVEKALVTLEFQITKLLEVAAYQIVAYEELVSMIGALEARIKVLEEQPQIQSFYSPGKVRERYFDGCNWHTPIGNNGWEVTLVYCGDDLVEWGDDYPGGINDSRFSDIIYIDKNGAVKVKPWQATIEDMNPKIKEVYQGYVEPMKLEPK